MIGKSIIIKITGFLYNRKPPIIIKIIFKLKEIYVCGDSFFLNLKINPNLFLRVWAYRRSIQRQKQRCTETEAALYRDRSSAVACPHVS